MPKYNQNDIIKQSEGWNKFLELKGTNTDVFIYVDFSIFK